MSHVSVRDATIADAAPIAGFMTELGYPTTTEQMIKRLEDILSDPLYATFVAVIGPEVAGMAAANLGRFYERDGWYGRVLALAVREDNRGRGVGRALLNGIEGWVRSRDGREVTLNSSHFRTDAHTFYERSGYENTGARFIKRFEA